MGNHRRTVAMSDINVKIPLRLRDEIERIANQETLSISENVRALLDYGVRAYREENGLEPGTY